MTRKYYSAQVLEKTLGAEGLRKLIEEYEKHITRKERGRFHSLSKLLTHQEQLVWSIIFDQSKTLKEIASIAQIKESQVMYVAKTIALRLAYQKYVAERQMNQ